MNSKMRVYIIFNDEFCKREAEDFLLKMNIPFESALKRTWISVSQSNFQKFFLDLYLDFQHCYSVYGERGAKYENNGNIS